MAARAPRGHSLPGPAWVVVLLLSAGRATPGFAAPPASDPQDVRAADALAAAPASRSRDRTLERWAERASLPELIYVLRRPREQLADAEATLLATALERTPGARTALRRRLVARFVEARPTDAKRWLGELGAPLPARPRASAFRVAVLLPDSGAYDQYGRAVRLGIQAGVAHHNAGTKLPLQLAHWNTGDNQPGRAAAALDSATWSAALVIGELLSAPTVAFATAARLLGIPLLSPTATDESVGEVGPAVFQVGPSGYQRGAALARVALAGGPRFGVLLSSRVEHSPLARGFEAVAESLGRSAVWRKVYESGSLDFRVEIRALKAKGVAVLLWEGEAREAETLVRQLAQEKVNVRLCGGPELDPEQFHANTQTLLEGVQFAGEDWKLAPGSQAVLDSLVRAAGEERANRLHVRGYLAARLVGSAVTGGALCPEELSVSLATRVGRAPYLRDHGFFDWNPSEASLPVFTVKSGRAVEVR